MKSMIEKGTLIISILKWLNISLSCVTLRVKKLIDYGLTFFY